jgi:hypothetical protein
VFTSVFSDALVINDDNLVPYQLLHQSKAASDGGTHSSKLEFNDIVDFVVPLPEKVFLAAEGFQTVVTTILQKSPDFGVNVLSPKLRGQRMVLRLFLTTGKSFKKHLVSRKMRQPVVEEMYRNIPLPHFVWVCEISNPDAFSRHEIWGEILWDATRNESEPNGWIALHYPELFVVDTGSALNGRQELIRFDLQNAVTYPLYRHNLQPI